MEENTTLTESLILVISLKSEIIDAVETEDTLVLKLYCFVARYCDCKDTLKITYGQRLVKVIRFLPNTLSI
jgi:hypothetical protein